MMGDRLATQESLFYEFRLNDHIPADHMLRAIDRFVDLDGLRRHLAAFYSTIGRPSIDPELMIRMLHVKRCISIWPIGGSAGSAWTVRNGGSGRQRASLAVTPEKRKHSRRFGVHLGNIR